MTFLEELEKQLLHAEVQMERAHAFAAVGKEPEYGGQFMWLMMYADWSIERDIIQEKIDGYNARVTQHATLTIR